MSETILQQILKNEKSVREIIDEAVSVKEATSVDLGDPSEDEQIQSTNEPADQTPYIQDDGEYRHLFVRRFHGNEEKPVKRVKLTTAMEAINLYFSWIEKYKQDKIEIWSDVAQDGKNFYRFCLKNRELLEDLWKKSSRMRRAGKLWTAAYKDIQTRARQSGNNLVGTFYPFVQEGK